MESWNTIDVRKNPMYVILDLGCTKSMGSRPAVNAFRAACVDYGMWTEILPAHSYFSFANSNTARVWENAEYGILPTRLVTRTLTSVKKAQFLFSSRFLR